ncbi:hypothetical protein CKO08_12725 [Halorhodospira halochloris]|nr:hypothetical protein [Halorhodospira halochloris]
MYDLTKLSFNNWYSCLLLEELPVNSPRNYSIKISLHYEEQHITAVWVYLTVKFEEHWKPVDVEVEFRCKFKERKVDG